MQEALPTLSKVTHLSVVLSGILAAYLLTVFFLFLYRKKAPWPRLARRGLIVMLGVYALVYLYLTFFYRPSTGDRRLVLRLFWSYREAFSLEGGFHIRRLGVARSIFLNVLLDLPLGFLLPALFCTDPAETPSRFRASLRRHPYRWTLAFVLVLSLGTEILQYFTGRGLCEFDDLFDNLLGAAIGCAGMAPVLAKQRRSCFSPINRI